MKILGAQILRSSDFSFVQAVLPANLRDTGNCKCLLEQPNDHSSGHSKSTVTRQLLFRLSLKAQTLFAATTSFFPSNLPVATNVATSFHHFFSSSLPFSTTVSFPSFFFFLNF
ncbi:hypothetical protein CsSME_00008341 [Camellia sinensis var. sinensis]